MTTLFPPRTVNTMITAQNVTTCALLSLATYEEDVVTYLNTHNTNYEIEIEHVVACDPNNVEHHFIVGISPSTKTVYIAFRGTDSAQDALQDLKFIQFPGVDFEGNFHKGFLERAQWLRIEMFLNYLSDGYRIICCGHSLGGAVAAIVGLRLMNSTNNNNARDNIFVVGFGAPMFGCEMVKRSLEQHQSQLVWFLNEMDIVPASLFLVHRVIGNDSNLKSSKFDLNSILNCYKTWSPKEDQSLLSIVKSYGSKIKDSFDWGTFSDIVQKVIKNTMKPGAAQVAVTVWKVIEVVAATTGELAVKVAVRLVKESKYVMIGTFFQLNANYSVSHYTLDHYLPIDEKVESTTKLSNCFNGHKMKNYLTRLNSILVKRKGSLKRSIKDISDWKITAIEPSLQEVLALQKGALVDQQKAQLDQKVLYTVSDIDINNKQSSFVIKFITTSKLTPLICKLTCKSSDVEITDLKSARYVAFKVTKKGPLKKEDSFSFTVYYWFGTVTFTHRMFYSRSVESHNFELYSKADPINTVLAAFRKYANYGNESDLAPFLESFIHTSNPEMSIEEFMKETTFDIKEKGEKKQLIEKINTIVSETCDMKGLSWKGWLLISGLSVAAGAAIIALAILNPFAAVGIGATMIGGAGNAGGAVAVGLGMGAMFGVGGGTLIGLSGPAAGLILHIRNQYKSTIESYYNAINTVLKAKKTSIEHLRQEIEGIPNYNFKEIEECLLEHKLALKKEKDPMPKFVEFVDSIANIRQSLILAPLRIGIYASTDEIDWEELSQKPLFRIRQHSITAIDKNHTELIRNGGFDVVVWFIDSTDPDADCSTCKEILKDALVEPTSLFCYNVYNNQLDVNKELKLVTLKLGDVVGSLICTNIKNPDSGLSIYGIDIVYSFILDQLSKEDCTKFSN